MADANEIEWMHGSNGFIYALFGDGSWSTNNRDLMFGRTVRVAVDVTYDQLPADVLAAYVAWRLLGGSDGKA